MTWGDQLGSRQVLSSIKLVVDEAIIHVIVFIHFFVLVTAVDSFAILFIALFILRIVDRDSVTGEDEDELPRTS